VAAHSIVSSVRLVMVGLLALCVGVIVGLCCSLN
jgi:hypothetical protein